MKIIVEFYKPIYINGFETNYLVSDYGSVKNKKTNKKLKPQEFYNKYLYVNLYLDGIMYRKSIHRMVAEAFIPNPENKSTVNHKSGNKQNNYVRNLEWNTSKENTNHTIDIGLMKNMGENSHLNKYPESLIIDVVAELLNGTENAKIAKMFNISQYHISEIRNKKTWKYLTKDIVFPKNDFNNSKYDKKIKKKIYNLLLNNKNNKEIREELNLENTKAIKSFIDRLRNKMLREKSSTTIPFGGEIPQ